LDISNPCQKTENFMKFLCIECDEAMKLTETRGSEDGSMTVIFGCSSCGKASPC